MTLTTEQKVNLTITPESSLNKPLPTSTLTGVPLWNVTDVSVISLVVAADGLSAFAVGAGVGTTTVNVIANAGTVASPIQIQGSISLTVTGALAASLTVNATTPVSQ